MKTIKKNVAKWLASRLTITLTFAQLQAYVAKMRAQGKLKPGEHWAVGTHRNAHYDEFVAFALLFLFGHLVWPGLIKPKLLFIVDAANLTEQQLLDLGVVPVGICHGLYDEHGRKNDKGQEVYTCAAHLVLAHLPILNGLKRPDGKLDQVLIAAIDNTVRYALKVDRNPVNDIHAASNDVKDRWNLWRAVTDNGDAILPEFLRPDPRFLDWDEAAEKVAWDTLEDIQMYLRTDIHFFHCVYDLVTKRQIEWHFLPVSGKKYQIAIAVIRENVPDVNNRWVARAARYIGADLVFKRSPEGHIYLAPDSGIWKYEKETELDPELDFRDRDKGEDKKVERVYLDLDSVPVLVAWRKLEATYEHKEFTVVDKGASRAMTDKELAAASVEASVFFALGKSPQPISILWGSQDAGQDTLACPIPVLELLLAVKQLLGVKEVPPSQDRFASRERQLREEEPQPLMEKAPATNYA